MRTIFFLATLLVATAAWAQIDVPDEVDPYRLVVATLATPIPDGAYLADGGWEVIGATSTQAPDTRTDGATLVWTGPPGEYTIIYDGVLLQDVSFVDGDGNQVTIRSYVGRIKERATCTIGGEPDPGPDPPDPPSPGGPYQIMLFYRADQLDNLPEPQRQLLTSRKVRDRLAEDGHVLLEALEEGSLGGSVPPRYKTWVDAVVGDPLPRIAIAPKEGGKVKDFDLPANVDLLLALLAEGGE